MAFTRRTPSGIVEEFVSMNFSKNTKSTKGLLRDVFEKWRGLARCLDFGKILRSQIPGCSSSKPRDPSRYWASLYQPLVSLLKRLPG